MAQEKLDTLTAGVNADALDKNGTTMTHISNQLEKVNSLVLEMGRYAKEATNLANLHQTLFQTLIKKFPNIQQFQTALNENVSMKECLEKISKTTLDVEEETMKISHIVEAQKLHQEKIQQALHAMQELSFHLKTFMIDENNDMSKQAVEELIEKLGK